MTDELTSWPMASPCPGLGQPCGLPRAAERVGNMIVYSLHCPTCTYAAANYIEIRRVFHKGAS